MDMQIPKRKAIYQRSEHEDAVVFLSKEGLKKLEAQIVRLQKIEEPKAIEDVSVAVQKGDLSENAEYHEARSRLTRIQNRIISLTERLKRVELIDPKQTDVTQIGSSVIVECDGKERHFQIVGPQETNPAEGRISYLSPIGSALLDKKVNDLVEIEINDTQKKYRILSIG